ncbi:hypothetical protein EJB05_12496, partial [Eragrostis curvula]
MSAGVSLPKTPLRDPQAPKRRIPHRAQFTSSTSDPHPAGRTAGDGTAAMGRTRAAAAAPKTRRRNLSPNPKPKPSFLSPLAAPAPAARTRARTRAGSSPALSSSPGSSSPADLSFLSSPSSSASPKPKPRARARARAKAAPRSPLVASPRAAASPSPAASPAPATAAAAASNVGELRSAVTSQLEALKRRLDALHSRVHADLDASLSRVSKRAKVRLQGLVYSDVTLNNVKMAQGNCFETQNQACQQLTDEVDKEYKKMSDNIKESSEKVKAKYKQIIAEAQSSTTRVCKVTIPEMTKTVEEAIEGLCSRYNISMPA